MLDAHRAGPIDHSRRIWTLLVFLLWHGIFVEQRICPEIPEPAYPVRPERIAREWLDESGLARPSRAAQPHLGSTGAISAAASGP